MDAGAATCSRKRETQVGQDTHDAEMSSVFLAAGLPGLRGMVDMQAIIANSKNAKSISVLADVWRVMMFGQLGTPAK